MQKVRIISSPFFRKCPKKMNEAWIGVEIPLWEDSPKDGDFIVYVTDAIGALDQNNKKAAKWWRKWVSKNLAKEIPGIKFSFQFVFKKSCGVLVDE